MRVLRRKQNRRLFAAITALSLLLASLLPDVALALSALEDEQTVLICTPEGLKRVDVGTGDPAQTADGSPCEFCVFCHCAGLPAPGRICIGAAQTFVEPTPRPAASLDGAPIAVPLGRSYAPLAPRPPPAVSV